MSKLSVIIPTYNEEGVIRDCLSSLNNQTIKDFEIIVVDDGSTDKTMNILSGMQEAKYRLQILKQKHKGPGEARNLGVKRSKGEVIVFVDADMTFDKNFLKELTSPIVEGAVKGTFSKNEMVSNWDNVWARSWNINEGWEDGRRHPKDYPDSQKVFRAILKSEFEKVGGFDPSLGYMDDWSLSKKLGYEAKNVKGAKFYHKNPETLKEIFSHAKWVAKRPYKLGGVGKLVALVRVSLPISVLVGLFKSVIHLQPAFFVPFERSFQLRPLSQFGF